MWFLVALAAALLASGAFFLLEGERKKYKLGFLALMLWGVALMVAVDHSIAYLEGEPFISAETDGLVGNSFLLGVLMLVPVLAIWAIATFTKFGEKIYSG